MKEPWKHLDNSKCKLRKSMPSKSQIAKYWAEKSLNVFGYLMDIGEPSCWACGYWNHDNDDKEFAKIEDIWNSQGYLERCHIYPKKHGGCNCEANLVLLCKKCHRESPDTKNDKIFARWLTNRQAWYSLFESELNRVNKELGYQIDFRDHEIIQSYKFKAFVKENGVFIGGRMSKSTIIACLEEFKGLCKIDET